MISNRNSLISLVLGKPHLEPIAENDQNMAEQQDVQGAWGLWPEEPANQNGQQGLNVQHEVAFDMNEPGEAPLEDPGLVENMPGHLEEPLPQNMVEEDVIVASSDSEGHNEEVSLAADQIPILPDLNVVVEVFIAMEDGQLMRTSSTITRWQRRNMGRGPVVVGRRPCEPHYPTLLSLGGGRHLKRESHPSPITLVFWGD
jgi:hypothetical protein